MGDNNGVVRGTNYFVANAVGSGDDIDGVGSGSCSGRATCERKTLTELQALTSVTGWTTGNWNSEDSTEYPHLRYAQVEAHCSDGLSSGKATCLASSASWLAEGDECGDSTVVICGDVIPAQPTSSIRGPWVLTMSGQIGQVCNSNTQSRTNTNRRACDYDSCYGNSSLQEDRVCYSSGTGTEADPFFAHKLPGFRYYT